MNITVYIKEFLGVCNKILRDSPEYVTSDYLLIPSPELLELLGKNKFDTEQHKLKLWRALHWIKCDPNRYDSKITLNGERKRYVVIYKGVYEALAALENK